MLVNEQISEFYLFNEYHCKTFKNTREPFPYDTQAIGNKHEFLFLFKTCPTRDAVAQKIKLFEKNR